MKKVILSLVFVLATGVSFMNANTTPENTVSDDCTTDAWEWGTEAGDGDRQQEYELTNSYFEYYCNEDGSYKLDMVISE